MKVYFMRTASWLTHQTNAFFGSDKNPPVTKPDSFRFCSSCGAMRTDNGLVSCSMRSSSDSLFTEDFTSTCHKCAQGADCRGGRLRAAGISVVYCGWCDDGTPAEALRSWKSTPGNEANCLDAGRLLGEMLLGRCDDNILVQPGLPQGNVLVPIPGWWGRRLRRGFDAPQRLAEGISEILGWPVWCPLSRVHGGRTAGKNRKERQKTSLRSFCLRSDTRHNVRKSFNLWLVDDLLASGSTSAAASTLLCRLHPRSISLVTANVRN